CASAIASKARKYSRAGERWNWWTATYAVSRPYAVESHTSSAAAKRTSTGNWTAAPGRLSTHARSSASTAGSAARGTAYSLSTKRTRRLVAKTRQETSSYSRRDSTRVASRLSPGTHAGRSRPASLTTA